MKQILLTKKNLKAILLVCSVVFLLYSPSINNDFVNWDDDAHVVENPFVSDFDLKTIFTTTVNKIYIPLTTFSFAVEHSVFGFDPRAFHLTNTLLHIFIVGCVLLFGLALGLSLRASIVAAFIFGIHPMHVESVTWITERKDVLYGFFYMASLLFYCRYLQEENFRKRIFLFIIVGILGLLSLLAKPMALSLVLIFMLCDWYFKRPRSREGLYTKGIFALLCVPVVWMSYFFHMRTQDFDFPYSIFLWLRCFTFHIQKFFWPDYFVLTYDIPLKGEPFFPELIGSSIIAACILIALWAFRKNRLFVFAVLFYFLSTFFLYRIDTQADFNIVADRFMYLPSVGFCLWIGNIYQNIFLKAQAKRLSCLVFFVVVFIAVFGLCRKTVYQIGVWRDGQALWSNQLRYEPQTAPALVFNRLADARMKAGIFNQQTQRLLEKSLQIKPDYVEAHYNLGLFYAHINNKEKAFEHFKQASALNPDHFNALVELGKIFQQRDQHDTSIVYFEKALFLQPDNKRLYIRILDNYKSRKSNLMYGQAYESLKKRYDKQF